MSLLLIQLQEQYPSCLDPFFTLFLFCLVCRGLNDWLRCYCYVGLVAHFLFSSVWWWRAHAHKGLEYKPTTHAFTREFIVVIVIFVVVVCIYISVYIYKCVCQVSLFFFLQWGVATWRAKFTFTLIIITCSFHIYTINVIYLARIFLSNE